jgi:hypothetical protein
MNPGLWLCDVIADRAIPLEPFFVRDTCPKCGARELFLLHRLDELEFRNPASGHVLKKPVADMPFSPEARERLMELTRPPSGGEQAPRSSETAEVSTRRASAREDGAAPDSQRASRPESGPSPPGLAQRMLERFGVRRARRPESEPSPPDFAMGNTMSWRPQRAPQPEIEPSSAKPPWEKHTILFLAANPTGTDRIALDREARAIQVELERSGFRDRFELVTRWAAEPLDRLRELRKLRPTVIHFSGQGGRGLVGEQRSGHEAAGRDPPQDRPGGPGSNEHVQDHGLYFQGPDGQPQLVPTSALQETFEAVGPSVKLVVLNACYSEGQAEALLAHIDCVVGVGGSIRDDAARNFAIGFYGGLGERESVAVAYKQGCVAISLEGLRDGERPQLKVRAGVDAARLVLAAEP